MSDDDDLPVRYQSPKYQPPAQKGQASRVHLPQRTFLGAKIDGAASRASLEFERTETERQENAANYIQAQTRASIAQYGLETVEKDFAVIDAQRDAELARLNDERARSTKQADAQISEFEAYVANNQANKEEALERAAAARARREALEGKGENKAGDVATRIEARKDRQRQCLVEMAELDEVLLSLQHDAQTGDPVAGAQMRLKNAERTMLHEELERLKREINELSREM